jgi:hypothetical protein
MYNLSYFSKVLLVLGVLSVFMIIDNVLSLYLVIFEKLLRPVLVYNIITSAFLDNLALVLD